MNQLPSLFLNVEYKETNLYLPEYFDNLLDKKSNSNSLFGFSIVNKTLSIATRIITVSSLTLSTRASEVSLFPEFTIKLRFIFPDPCEYLAFVLACVTIPVLLSMIWKLPP